MPTSETETRPTPTSSDDAARGGGGKAGGGRISRRIPRSLSAAAHVTAGGIWTFVAAAALIALWGSTLDGFEDVMSWVLFVVIGLPVLGTAFAIGLAVAFAGAAVTLPLAVAWFRKKDRDGSAATGLVHLAVAAVAGLYVLVRVAT